MNDTAEIVRVRLILGAIWDKLPTELRQFKYTLENNEIKVLCNSEEQAQDIKNLTYVHLLDQARLLGFGRQVKEITYAWRARPSGISFPLNM